MKGMDQLLKDREAPFEMVSLVQWAQGRGPGTYLLALAHLSVVGEVLTGRLVLGVGETIVSNWWALHTSAVALLSLAQGAGLVEAAQFFEEMRTEALMAMGLFEEAFALMEGIS